MLFVVRCWMFVVRCFFVWYVIFVVGVCCLLFVVVLCCLEFGGVCCLLLFVDWRSSWFVVGSTLRTVLCCCRLRFVVCCVGVWFCDLPLFVVVWSLLFVLLFFVC